MFNHYIYTSESIYAEKNNSKYINNTPTKKTVRFKKITARNL